MDHQVRLGVGSAIVEGQVVVGDVELDNGVVSKVGVTSSSNSSLAIPGFIDVHTHGYGEYDFLEASQEDHERVSRMITNTGVVAYQPTLMSAPMAQIEQAVLNHPGHVQGGARVLGFHLEGPFLSRARAGAHHPEHLIEPDRDAVERILKMDQIEQVTLAPELPGAIDATRTFAQNGVTVSLGHSEADPNVVETAIAAGATAFTHVFNAMGPFTHREPGIVGAALSSDNAYPTGIFDGVHLSKEAEKILIRCSGERLVAITDAVSLTKYSRAELVDGAPRLSDGTIAGSLLTMDEAFRRLIELGLDPQQAVNATSVAPSMLAGLDRPASLSPGNRGDVVILDDRYQVVQTFVDGVEVFRV